ncbi:YlxQ-related RNA-binding protein [Streptococcaceae bacterium ESL0729]|nr:YlxQ-related RNA-binding protein [Streptococcaceae bacterium ESL0729]
MNDKVLNLLGLAKRAGKLTSGEDLVVKSIQNGKAKLVFLGHDASKNLIKKITDKTSYYEVSMTDIFSTLELSQAVGEPRKVIAVTDRGFAKKMGELMEK